MESRFLFAMLALALFGCATVPSNPAPGVAGVSESADRSGDLIYVTDGNQMLIYNEEGDGASLVAQITDGINNAYSLYVDSGQRLYVSNIGNGTVTAYDRASNDPIAVHSGLSYPYYMATDRHGTLFVGAASTIVEYLLGATSPYKTLQVDGTETDGLDFDAAGNLYVAFRRHDGLGSVEEFRPGSTQGRRLGMKLYQPQGLIVDRQGNLFVAITGKRELIEVFPPASTTASSHIVIPGKPSEIALTRNGHEFFVTSFAKGDIYEGAFPFHGLRVKLHVESSGAVQGVAITNGL
ncbi:MAG TPA: hypothetical protein VN936_05790 [Candidatus Acidoferrum sp.]|nr:hypothetical protein [Candidatus Acidoferrum sp.]